MLALALAKPEWGAPHGPLAPELTRTLGIILIFTITGLTLRTRELKRGLASVRLHLFVQTFSFMYMPAVAWLFVTGMAGNFPPEMLQGILVLSIMPTTITSCVVFTTMARGNVAGSVFNSLLGNLLGVVVSPVLFTLLIARSAGVRIDWTQLGSIAQLIVIPLLAGLAMRPLLRRESLQALRFLPYVSSVSLLIIVYFAFCSAFAPASPLWDWSGLQMALPFLSVLGLHLFFLASAWILGGVVRLSELDRRAALFVGPQKTVALGLPLLHFFFASQPELAGLMSIPLILYHPLQLLIAGFLATRLARRESS